MNTRVVSLVDGQTPFEAGARVAVIGYGYEHMMTAAVVARLHGLSEDVYMLQVGATQDRFLRLALGWIH